MEDLRFFIPAIIGLVAAWVTAIIAGRYQVRVAEKNVNKDIEIQRDKIIDKRSKMILSIDFENLKAIHKILSEISLESSFTMAHIQYTSRMDIDIFRSKYFASCGKLHEAMAISGIFYPEMTEKLQKIYGLANEFWGRQESLLRIDRSEDPDKHDRALGKVLEASKKFDEPIDKLKAAIENRAEQIRETSRPVFDKIF